MYGSQSQLFAHDRPISELFRQKGSDMVVAARRLSDRELGSDVDALAPVREAGTLSLVRFDRAAAKSSVEETWIRLPVERGGGGASGYRLTARIPFSGSPQLFQYQPTQYQLVEVHGKVEGSELVLVLEYPQLVAEQDMKSRRREAFERVDSMIEFANRDALGYLARLDEAASAVVDAERARRAQLRGLDDTMKDGI